MSDHRAPTLEYQTPPPRWRTHRWWTVWLPMSVTLLAVAAMCSMFVQHRRAQAERALALRQAAQAAAQSAMIAQAQTLSHRDRPIVGVWSEGEGKALHRQQRAATRSVSPSRPGAR